MMDELGARLFAIWEATPYNGHWPQVTIIWEIDAFADYARIGRAQARGGSHEAAAAKWSAFLADIGASGEGRIMYPRAEQQDARPTARKSNFTAGLVIQEIMQTKPGRQDDYIRELERLYVPWSESTGKRWLGSFTTTFRFNEVIHYWALEGGWDCFENHYPSWKDSPPAEIVTWMSVAPALRDGWEDSILQALPPVATAVNARSEVLRCRTSPTTRSTRRSWPIRCRTTGSCATTIRCTTSPKWDTFALSRFDDIWHVLEVNDGTFVASEGTLPAASVLAHHNDGPVADPPLHPMPFHAKFDSPIYDGVRRCTLGAVAAEVGRQAGRPDPRAGQRTARRAVAARHVRPHSGLRRDRRGLGGVRIGRTASRFGGRCAGDRQRGQPGQARRRRRTPPTRGRVTWIT